MNKINQTKDFLFSFPHNGIINPELDNYYNSKISEDKSFSDLNFFSLGNKPHNINYELKNDLSILSINSFEDFQSSKKTELEFEFFSKDLDKKKDEFDEVQKYLKSNIHNFIENHKELLPLKTFDDCNYDLNYKFDNYTNAKILEKNENENENELTNQNSRIFYKMHKRKNNKFKKKIKFIVFSNKNKTKISKKIKKNERYENLEGKENEDKNIQINKEIISKEIYEKMINIKDKYKCEHPGCRKTFRTMKLKINRHDFSDYECKKDTITLLYMIRNVKNIINKLKRKNNSRINRIKKYYKKCIFILPHKDYAINIAGENLIN